MPDPVVDHAVASPAPALGAYVRRYTGYRYRGLPPGTHLGLPSREVTVVLALDEPTRMAALPDPAAPPADLMALAGGLHTRPAVIVHDGAMEGIQLSLTPAGSRVLLGVPAGELAHTVVTLDALLGRDAGELLERLHATVGWPARFALLDATLLRRAGTPLPASGLAHARRARRTGETTPSPALAHAWHLISASGGGARIADVAAAVGYSRRRLDVLFAREFGLGPKPFARVVRFERSHTLLKADPERNLAELAATCGYYDQAHMARDWNALAGCPPSRWLAGEEIPFVQDETPDRERGWAA